MEKICPGTIVWQTKKTPAGPNNFMECFHLCKAARFGTNYTYTKMYTKTCANQPNLATCAVFREAAQKFSEQMDKPLFVKK